MFESVTYSGIVTGNPYGGGGTKPYPINFFNLKFFGYSGPFPSGGVFDDWVNYSSSGSFTWGTSPQYPNKSVSLPYGNYTAAYGGTTIQKDVVYARARMFDPQTFAPFDALGRADLTWQLSSQNSNLVGSGSAVFINEAFWIQAAANLPTPISYSWLVNDEPQTWNGGFVSTSFATNGNKALTVTMTGADNTQVVLTWNVWVKCLPPAPPYADDCNVPP